MYFSCHVIGLPCSISFTTVCKWNMGMAGKLSGVLPRRSHACKSYNQVLIIIIAVVVIIIISHTSSVKQPPSQHLHAPPERVQFDQHNIPRTNRH